jgi:hypothetical protein
MSIPDYPYYFEFNKAMNLRESEPDVAIEILSHLREEAIKRSNHYWRLTAEHWRVQVYISFKRDYRNANRFAVEAAIESRKAEYQHYQEYICIQNDLILVYEGIDPLGYATEIKEAIDLTINQTNPTMSCHYCLNHRLGDYYLNMGEEQKARDQSAKFFAMTHSQAHYRIQAYEQICYFSRQDEAWADLLELAKRGYELAADNDDEAPWINLKSFELLALQKLGRSEAAQSSYSLLKHRTASLKMVQSEDYYDNLVAYEEARGDIEAALAVRSKHLEIFKNAGRHYWEAMARIDKIRLLRLLDRDYGEESQAVRLIAQDLKSSASIIERLETIAP